MTESRSLNKEVFLLFYGAIIGFAAGLWGNLWATLYFEYILKGDANYEAHLSFYFWAVTFTSIALVVILGVATVYYFKRMRRR